MQNNYKGFHPSLGGAVPRVPWEDVQDAELFFKEYISKHKPVVIEGIPEDLQNVKEWSNSYLKRVAGDSKVSVETVHEGNKFGKGLVKKDVAFRTIAESIANGETCYYITTQDIKVNEKTGQPNVTSSPVTELIYSEKGVPIKPKLFGNLIPMNLNIWMGNSKDGSCTGLHHDYHDNLYVLLRGRKKFQLYSPLDTEYMYTQGNVERVHKNGRINYMDFPTNPDGSEKGALVAQEASDKKSAAEAALAKAEEDLANGVKGAQERVNAAEAALDEALEDVLDSADFEDDFDEMESDSDDNGSNSDGQDEDDRQVGEAPPSKRAKIDPENNPRETPLNFSKVQLDKPIDKTQFPLFHRATQITCEIKPNEMLFLPAGWFHCVTSYSDNDVSDKAEYSGHLAFNYWMHPADTDNYKKPYSSDFWLNDWKARGDKIV